MQPTTWRNVSNKMSIESTRRIKTKPNSLTSKGKKQSSQVNQ
uniref:Uncharacterized protein n=1 Tax=Arundo donax TaxID=35708 RepID=A0A0A9FS22_ARUDO